MKTTISEIFNYYNIFILFYFLAINFSYLALLFLAAQQLYYFKIKRFLSIANERDMAFIPSIAILVPAHNEAATILENVRALRQLDYPELEIVVINGGPDF